MEKRVEELEARVELLVKAFNQSVEVINKLAEVSRLNTETLGILMNK